jgi:hypothetical protein
LVDEFKLVGDDEWMLRMDTGARKRTDHVMTSRQQELCKFEDSIYNRKSEGESSLRLKTILAEEKEERGQGR